MRKGIFTTVWIAAVAVIVVLSSLLVGQNVALRFPSASVQQCSINAGSTHVQNQRFDSDGLQWTAPVDAFVILRTVGRANWKFTQPALEAIRTKGFHFNRPPPTY
jgi:hypothetical protein